jgi:hypothetical protein
MSAAWDAAALAALTEGWRDGRSYAEMAVELGVTVSAVRSMRHRRGLPPRSADATEATNAINGLLHDTGLRVLRRRQVGWSATPKDPPSPLSAWEALPLSAPRAFEDRRRGECHWPIGDPARACCLPQAEGSPYCADHRQRARNPSLPPRLR